MLIMYIVYMSITQYCHLAVDIATVFVSPWKLMVACRLISPMFASMIVSAMVLDTAASSIM